MCWVDCTTWLFAIFVGCGAPSLRFKIHFHGFFIRLMVSFDALYVDIMASDDEFYLDTMIFDVVVYRDKLIVIKFGIQERIRVSPAH